MDNVIQLPHSEEIERVVLGTIINERNAFNEVKELLSDDCFYIYKHKEIYKAIESVFRRGDRPDLLAVTEELRKAKSNVQAYDIVDISGCNTFDLVQHATYLSDLDSRRKGYMLFIQKANQIIDLNNDVYDITCSARTYLDDMFKDSSDNISSMDNAINGLFNQINRNCSADNEISGTPTGFSKFDLRTGGLQKSDLIIIAGETSSGKTSLSVSIMLNAALSGSKIAMYSMEMKKEQIASRMLSMVSGISSSEILYSHLPDDTVRMLLNKSSELTPLGIFFDDRSTSNIETIISSIISMKMKHDIDGAIIDYLQILNVNMKNGSKEQQMADAARRLKNLAKDLDIWIIALSQLNRDNQNPAPSLNRLRDSGQIAEAADIVMFVYRPEVYNKNYPIPYQNFSTKGTALIDVAKGRNIGMLNFIAGFDKNKTLFYELKEIPHSNYEDEQPF